ncbi:hypothetical protein DPSP01_004612 [Paraphaeosphaeria sporulosa]
MSSSPPPLRLLSRITQQAPRIRHQKHQLRAHTTPLTACTLSAPSTGTRAPCSSFSAPFPSSHRSPHPARLFSSSPTMSDAAVESAKRAAAQQAVKDHFDPTATNVGIGSGTTIVYVVEAIKQVSTNPAIRFIPTGYQSRQVIVQAGLTPVAFDSLPEDTMFDVAFDGADEVDAELNCIKGGGACLFQEKLVAERAKKFVCVADYRKKQDRLLTVWPTIPIEVAPIAVPTVLKGLRTLGSNNPKLRTTLLEKSGPLKTDQDFFIVDAPFKTLLCESDVKAGKGKGDGSDGTWEVNKLSEAIKALTGVLEVGIFSGLNGPDAEKIRSTDGVRTVTSGQKPVAVYFGMQDGTVEVRTAK